MNFLSEQEKAQLRIRHKKERDGRVRDRIKAVLLTDEGWTPQQIAKVLLISDQAVRDHVEDYKSRSKLQPKSGGSVEKLSKKQSEQLEAHLQKHTYLYVKDMMAYIEIEFGIKYTVPGIRNWLQRHGFSYKKPSVVSGKANKEQQEKWLKEYEKLREKLPLGEAICFIDGVHPTHNVQPAYGWIKKGVRKEIPANTGRARLNLSGAVDVTSHNILIQEDKTLNAESTIQFFQNIEKAYPGKEKIHVFCDNAPYYRNKKVKKYLEFSKIVLHFLPPYSPNLNPIERLWKWMKERVIYNTYYEHFEEFKGAIMGFFALLSTLGADSLLGRELRSKVRDQFRPIGAPSANF
ncbi:MAG: IS630 family transposase [Simkania sp.]|nr:IS630 family transposase [Simkania sp.]